MPLNQLCQYFMIVLFFIISFYQFVHECNSYKIHLMSILDSNSYKNMELGAKPNPNVPINMNILYSFLSHEGRRLIAGEL